jgi:hypothetical protein
VAPFSSDSSALIFFLMAYSMEGAGAIRARIGAFRFETLDFAAGASSEGAKTAGPALIF